MSIVALHPERRYPNRSVVPALIEQLDQGNYYDTYQLSRDERYRALSELAKVLANVSTASAVQAGMPSLALEEIAPLLAANDQLQGYISEHLETADYADDRKASIQSAVSNPDALVKALRLIEGIHDHSVLFGNAVTYHSQLITASLNLEIQALAKARLESFSRPQQVDIKTVERGTTELSEQIGGFLFSAMPLVANGDQAQLKDLARSFLADVDQLGSALAAKLIEQQIILRETSVRKKESQVILDIDDAFRSFNCAVAAAIRFLQLAHEKPGSAMLKDYQKAAGKLPFSSPDPNGKDTEISDLNASDKLLEIYGVVKSVRAFREGSDKVVTAIVVADFLDRDEVEATISYNNLLRYSVAAGSTINLQGEAYESDGEVKFRIKQVPYSKRADESWENFLHKEVMADFQRHRGGLYARWCSNLADSSWINEPLDAFRLYRT